LLLEHFGYTVLSTSSVAQMHAMLRNECPDMLLLDTNDPALDCEEVAGWAKTMCPGILSVVLTPEYGLAASRKSGSVDRYLKIDGPREEWQSGIESLFDEQAENDASESKAM
jgi:CheY-like chemotaxis protein